MEKGDASLMLSSWANHDPCARAMPLSALALGMFWCINTSVFSNPQWTKGGLLLGGALLAILVTIGWRPASWLTLVYVMSVGVADRLGRVPFAGSDVLTATREAIAVLANGQNPYAHTYLTTNPPSSPFPYPPGEIAFYAIPNAIFGRIDSVDAWCGIGILFLLGGLALRIGSSRAALAVAIYAAFGHAAQSSVDGSNDTSLAFLIVSAVTLLALSQRSGHASRTLFYSSAVVFAWALLFKQFAWFIYPFILIYLRRRDSGWRSHATVTVGLTALTMLPFFFTAPTAFVRNILVPLRFHKTIAGLNLWTTLERLTPGVVTLIEPALPIILLVIVAVAVLVLARRPALSLGVALLQGVAVLFGALFFARWTSLPYYTLTGALFITGVALVDAQGSS